MRKTVATAAAFLWISAIAAAHAAVTGSGYDSLVSLSSEWREFAKPTIKDCLPDYSPAAMATKAQELKSYQSRVASISTAGWSDSQQIDYELFKAELNGMDFDLRVLKPWVRDPTFYASVWAEQSDVPEHEVRPPSPPSISTSSPIRCRRRIRGNLPVCSAPSPRCWSRQESI